MGACPWPDDDTLDRASPVVVSLGSRRATRWKGGQVAGLQVWISGGGTKYHANQACSGLVDGQRKAERTGRSPWPIRGVDIAELPSERMPCMVCWPDEPGWSDWSALEHQVLRTADSPYEVEFFGRVLKNIPGLRPPQVLVQHEFTYDLVKQARMDFAIVADDVKIAIEVDGLHKSPTGQPTDAQQQSNATARQNALTGQGWRVLRFPNSDVRLDPDRCRAEIERCLRHSSPPLTQLLRAEAPESRRPPQASRPAPTRIAESDTGGSGAAARAIMAHGHEPRRRNRTLVLVAVAVAVLAAVAVPIALLTASRSPGPGSAVPNGSTCPSGFPVKGNESQSGELIYHEPGWAYYARTRPEQCFVDGRAAEDAGFRASEVR